MDQLDQGVSEKPKTVGGRAEHRGCTGMGWRQYGVAQWISVPDAPESLGEIFLMYQCWTIPPEILIYLTWAGAQALGIFPRFLW